ncbi:MAG: hypothetical protein PF517_12390 [Salinivirgaceae bacterium]|jgi:hypothetical protein|nr:hypothetical protein [Salinivirgaceae bacterium]
METLLEHILTSAYKDEMISFMNDHPECFEEAINLAIADKQPYSWRSAWLLWSCMKKNDLRIQGHISKIIKSLMQKDDGHQRELLKILMQMDLDEDQEGYLFDICVTVWEKINKKPSVRFFALKFIILLAKKHPDLSNEVVFLTQNHYLDLLSPDIKRSIIKMTKEFTS